MPHWLHTENASLNMNFFFIYYLFYIACMTYICHLYEHLCSWADQTEVCRCMTVYTINSPLKGSKFLMDCKLNSNWSRFMGCTVNVFLSV